MPEFYVQKANKWHGPFDSEQLKKLAKTGQLTPELYVSKGKGGKQVVARDIKGLFSEPTELAPIRTQIVPEPVVVQQIRPAADMVDCPYCGEEIRKNASKCKHCGEFLDDRMRPAYAAQPPSQVVNVVTNVVAPQQKRWHKGTAMVLSFFWPGLGQIYKGQLINGIAWMVFTLVGYAAFIVPGIVLHFCCLIGAGMGDEHR